MQEVNNFSVIVNPQVDDINAAIARGAPAVLLSQTLLSPTQLLLTFGQLQVGQTPAAAAPPACIRWAQAYRFVPFQPPATSR